MSPVAQPIVKEFSAVFGKSHRLDLSKRWTYIDTKHARRSQLSKHALLKRTCPILVMFGPNDDVQAETLTCWSASR